MNPEPPIEQLVRRFYEELWNNWNDAAVEELLADDFRFRGSLGQSTTGHSEWRSYRDMIRLGSPDFYNQVQDLVVNPQRAAARLLYTGTHCGPLLGLPPTGRRFTYAGAAFFSTAGGQLTKAWILGDVDTLRHQLTRADSTPAAIR